MTAAPVRDTAEIEEAIAKLGRERGSGLIVPPDPFTIVHHELIMRLAMRHGLPAVYAYRSYVVQGALMSYGPDPYDMSGARLLMIAFKGGEACGLARSAADQVRTCDQPQDREDARPRRAADKLLAPPTR